jgi:hypothetical protein
MHVCNIEYVCMYVCCTCTVDAHRYICKSSAWRDRHWRTRVSFTYVCMYVCMCVVHIICVIHIRLQVPSFTQRYRKVDIHTLYIHNIHYIYIAYIHIYTHSGGYTRRYIYVRTYIHTCHEHTYMPYIQPGGLEATYIYTHTHTYTYTNTCSYTYTLRYIYIHRYANTGQLGYMYIYSKDTYTYIIYTCHIFTYIYPEESKATYIHDTYTY